MSLPDAAGQARTAITLLCSGGVSRALFFVTGIIGKRLPRAVAAVLDILAFAAAAVVCAAALFVSGGEARVTTYALFFAGLFIAGIPRHLLQRRRQEKSPRAANDTAKGREG